MMTLYFLLLAVAHATKDQLSLGERMEILRNRHYAVQEQADEARASIWKRDGNGSWYNNTSSPSSSPTTSPSTSPSSSPRTSPSTSPTISSPSSSPSTSPTTSPNAAIPVEESKSIKCVFVRQAESTWNEAATDNFFLKGFHQGADMMGLNKDFQDALLSDWGDRQAVEAGHVFKAKYPEVQLEDTLIFSSPMRRAMQTAHRMFPDRDSKQQKIYTTPYLREVSSNSDNVSFIHDLNDKATKQRFEARGFEFDLDTERYESNEKNFRHAFNKMVTQAIDEGKTTLVIVGGSYFGMLFQQAKAEIAEQMKNKMDNAQMMTFDFNTSEKFSLDFWDRINNIDFGHDDTYAIMFTSDISKNPERLAFYKEKAEREKQKQENAGLVNQVKNAMPSSTSIRGLLPRFIGASQEASSASQEA